MKITVWACTECNAIATSEDEKTVHPHDMIAKRIGSDDLDYHIRMTTQVPWVSAADMMEDEPSERRAIAKLKSRI